MPEEKPNQIPEEIPEEEKPRQAGGATDAFAPELTERSREAIRGGVGKLIERPKKEEPSQKPQQPPPPQPRPSAGQPSSQPPTGQPPSQPSPAQTPTSSQPAPGGKSEAPKGQTPSKPPSPSDVKEPSKLGKLGSALGQAGTAANIARHPKEGAKEAGKALAGAAAKKAAKEVGKRALQALTSETVIGPAIIEALDKLSNLLKKIPGVSGLSEWAWKNKLLVIGFLVLLWLLPGIIFAAGLGGGLGGTESEYFSPGEGIYAGSILDAAKYYIGKLNTYSQPRRTDFANGYSDCSSFVSKVLNDIGVRMPLTWTGGMADLWDRGKHPNVQPVLLLKGQRSLTREEAAMIQPGDIIIWGNAYSQNGAHTAIIEGVSGDTLYYIDSTRGGVKQRQRSINRRTVWGVYRVVR